MTYLKIVKDEENGIESQVYYMNDGRIGVRLFDTDCELNVGVRIFNKDAIDAAFAHADELINPSYESFTVTL